MKIATMYAGAAALAAATIAHAQPQYTIHDLGLVDSSDFAAQGYGVSSGGVAVGRSAGASNQAFSWTLNGGLTGLPNLDGRAYGLAYDANDSGYAVGDATTTFTGAGSLPVIWNNGVVSQLPLMTGEDIGRARAINSNGVVVGSNSSGSLEYGVYWSGGSVNAITQTTNDGAYLVVANDVNDAGRVVGFGIDPNNAARNVGFVYDINTNEAFEVGALDGMNGALAFGIGDGGHIVGSSMNNQGSGMPFIWTDAEGMTAIPLPGGTSQGSARDVNASGWAVGTASGAFAVPFLYDGSQTYTVQDLILNNPGWDLTTNTYSSALGIADDGTIVGTGLFNGEIRAYAMIPVPAPGALSLLGAAGLIATRRRR